MSNYIEKLIDISEKHLLSSENQTDIEAMNAESLQSIASSLLAIANTIWFKGDSNASNLL